MNNIVNPLTKKKYSLQSKEGKILLKKYIKQINGGSGILEFLKSLCKGRKCESEELHRIHESPEKQRYSQERYRTSPPRQYREQKPKPKRRNIIIKNDPKRTEIYLTQYLGEIEIYLRISSEYLINNFGLHKQRLDGITYNVSRDKISIIIRDAELQITNKGLNITGIITKVKGNEELNEYLVNTEYDLHNYLYNDIESFYDLNSNIDSLFRRYLTSTIITPRSKGTQLFLNDSRYSKSMGSEYYKIHFSINIEYWKETFDFLINFYQSNTKFISGAKFVFPKLSHHKDIEHDSLNNLIYNFDYGAGIANFVIYPANVSNKYIFKLIDKLVVEWMDSGLDEGAGRINNNLFFNERLTKAIYIGYGSDTNSKATSYIENRKRNKKIILDSSDNYVINGDYSKFRNTPELQYEIDNRCNRRLSRSKKNSINRCLKNKYNLRPVDLCSTKDLRTNDFRNIELKKDYSVNDRVKNRNVTLADNWVSNYNPSESYNNIINKRYGKRCYD